ncbi:MAG: hypothetical protein KGH64_05995 [Candidatus Micrarchaeota archaeon]|nr:hypothetical protein [Candidatus Micrarchaeota archaeon]
MTKQLKNLFVEVYIGREKRNWLTKSIDEVIEFLFLDLKLDIKTVRSVTDSLLEQRKDPNKFPNAIIMMDEDRNFIPIEELKSRYPGVVKNKPKLSFKQQSSIWFKKDIQTSDEASLVASHRSNTIYFQTFGTYPAAQKRWPNYRGVK